MPKDVLPSPLPFGSRGLTPASAKIEVPFFSSVAFARERGRRCGPASFVLLARPPGGLRVSLPPAPLAMARAGRGLNRARRLRCFFPVRVRPDPGGAPARETASLWTHPASGTSPFLSFSYFRRFGSAPSFSILYSCTVCVGRCGSGGKSCRLAVGGLPVRSHPGRVEVSLSKTPNPRLLLTSWLVPCMAADRRWCVNVCVNG